MTYIAHGTDPNEIGHGVDIDLNDTPGSSGGKFIGFGEPGTSAKANRAHWFLSQNIDHVYQEVHRDIAISKRYDRTSPGGGESYFQFPAGADIWVGDDTYPGSVGVSDPEGMQMLFNVVDANYNELTDTFDNEIRVKRVRETTGTTDIYQGGFEAEPRIYFVAVDPATGVEVTEPYTIPAGTNYKVLCGVKSTVAEMPADALIRLKVQASSEVEAGTFLQDGTRPMTGNLDLDGNNLINADVVSNVTGEPLDISSDHNLLFKDQYLSAGLALSESGQTALYQPVAALIHPSLVGAVNSNAEARELMSGNRTMDQTGSVSPSNAVVTYPDLKVMLQGQVVTIAGDTITAPDVTDTYYLCVTSAGVVVLLDDSDWGGSGATDPAAGSVLIWKGDYTSTGAGTGTWANPVDLRWPSTRRGNHMAVYVGDGVGADFASLNEAIIWITEAALIESSKISITYEIVIVGDAEVSSTVTIPNGWSLRGLGTQGTDRSLIYTTRTFPVDSHVIVAGSNSIIKNLRIMWYNNSASQDTDKAALSIGAGGVVENVSFYRDGTYVFGMNIHISAAAATTTDTIIRNCVFDRFAMAGVWAEGKARVRIEHSKFTCLAGIPSYHINLAPTDAIGDATSPAHTIVGCYFGSRASVANIQIGGPNVLIDSCHGVLDDLRSYTPFIKIVSAGSTQDKAGATIRNCLLESGFQLVSCVINNASLTLSVAIEGCVGKFSGTSANILDFNCTQVGAKSQVIVRDCNLEKTAGTGYAGYFKDVVDVKFVNNRVVTIADGLKVSGAVTPTIAVIDGNTIAWGTGYAIEMATNTYSSSIVNNAITQGSVTPNITAIELGADYINVHNNSINGVLAYSDVAIHITSRWNHITNNTIYGWGLYCIHINPGSSGGDCQWIANNHFEESCTRTALVSGVTEVVASAIYISAGGSYTTENLVISGNIFRSLQGSAIRCKTGLSSGTVVSNNVFTEVQGRHILTGPDYSKYAVIALELGGNWTISNNKFLDCGHASVLGGIPRIEMHAVYLGLAGTETVLINGNEFGNSIAKNATTINDSWYDIGINGDGHVICNNNSFFRDLSASAPKAVFAQINKANGSDGVLIISGCVFRITGTATYTAAIVYCVYSNEGVVNAMGCFSKVDYTCGTGNNLWYIANSEGNLIGNFFDGAQQVVAYVGGGHFVGNVHINLGGATAWSVGEHPSSGVYTSLTTISPLADFNKET